MTARVLKGIVSIVSILVALACVEIALRIAYTHRWVSGIPAFSPGRFADPFSEEFWILDTYYSRVEWNEKKPHPLLGWTHRFDAKTYIHDDYDKLDHRRPVLLYGDSYAECLGLDICFDTVCNEDVLFRKKHYLLNYGVHGYGVDQIYLLMKHSAGLYDNPIVIFSFMTQDLDRSLLRFRQQQKPYFTLDGDKLELHTPEDVTISQYIEAHPPAIRSYLFRMLLFSKTFPRRLREKALDVPGRIERNKRLNRHILDAAIRFLEDHHVRFFFVVFHPCKEGAGIIRGNDWRDGFILDYMKSRGVDYIYSKHLIRKDAVVFGHRYADYFQNNHPNERYVEIISKAILKRLFSGDNRRVLSPQTHRKHHLLVTPSRKRSRE